MGEMEDKIQQLLSSEEGMKKVMSLASALLSAQGNKTEAPPAKTESASKDENQSEGLPDMAKLQQAMSKIMGDSKKSTSSDSKLNLLTALKPFINSGRQGSIDRAARMVKTAKVAKTALEEFKGGNGIV
ncbi:MAG: hypothetical protein Q8878_04440 [Bacillota bacterium]|nr:hypothetical protein [Bacillota bacterium]